MISTPAQKCQSRVNDLNPCAKMPKQSQWSQPLHKNAKTESMITAPAQKCWWGVAGAHYLPCLSASCRVLPCLSASCILPSWAHFFAGHIRSVGAGLADAGLGHRVQFSPPFGGACMRPDLLSPCRHPEHSLHASRCRWHPRHHGSHHIISMSALCLPQETWISALCLLPRSMLRPGAC